MISECCRMFSLEAPGEILKFTASDEECLALSQRFGMKILSFSASMESFQALDGVSFLVRGEVKGTGEVLSPATSELVIHQIAEPFEVLLSPANHPKVILDEEADQEFFEEPLVDMGEICAQYLYLELDTASFDVGRESEDVEEAPGETHMPFLALQELLSKKDS